MTRELSEQVSAPGSPVPSTSPRKGFLLNRNFALLAIGQAISNMGDFIFSTTLLVWVFVLTHSAGAVSGILIAQYTPVFLFGPVAGVFVDRWNRRQTMIVADVVRAVVALFPLIVPGFLLLPTLYTSVFLISAFSRLFMPAKAGVLQVIVPEEQQAQATSLSQRRLRFRSFWDLLWLRRSTLWWGPWLLVWSMLRPLLFQHYAYGQLWRHGRSCIRMPIHRRMELQVECVRFCGNCWQGIAL